ERAAGRGGRARPALRRAALVAVHRQCGDDRMGRDRALQGGHDRYAGRARPPPLAARSGRRTGAGRGSEGMRIGVVGAGAWGTALAQVAAAGDQEVLLWAFEQDVAAAINGTHANPAY